MQLLHVAGLVAALAAGCGREVTTDSTTVSCPAMIAAWAPDTAYATGAIVTFAGAVYVCVQGHTAVAGWTPPATPALWAAAQCAGARDMAGDPGDASVGSVPGDAAAQAPAQCAMPSVDAIGDVPPQAPVTVGNATGIITTPPARSRPFLVQAGSAQDALINSYSESAWLAIVPRQSPRNAGFKCPAGGGTAYTWDPTKPDQLACGGQTFPNATDGHTTVSVTVLSGKTVTVPVWSVPGGGQSYVQEVIDYEKASFLYDKLERLASAYVKTKDEKYARRIALTLNEWAKYLPDYFITPTNSSKPISVAEASQMKFRGIQRMSDHNGVAHELDSGPISAMDAVYASSSLMLLSSALGYDVKQFIIDKLFLNEMDFMLNRVPIEEHTGGNLSFPYVQVARLATVLGRRDLVQWLDAYMERTVMNLTREGFYPESFHYGCLYLTENQDVTAQMGTFYGVWPPKTSSDAASQQSLSVYGELIARGLASVRLVRLPDGNLPPYGNTGFTYPEPARTSTRSGLMPVYGHLALGDGDGAQQTQLNLGFADRANHIEQDVLSIMLSGFQSELIGEIRDSRMPGRAFTESTFAHNTVAINRTTQSRGTMQGMGNVGHLFTSGSLLLFEANLNGIALAEVEGSRAYINVANRYQRMSILNTTDAAHPYVIDLFRVKGGTVHDYFLHGSPRFDEVTTPPDKSAPPAASSLSLQAMTGDYPLLEGAEKWVEPPTNDEPSYGAFRDVWTARSTGQFDVTFKELAGPRATRIFMVDDADTDVFVAKSPNPFRDKSPDTTDATGLYHFWRPSLLVRRRGTTALDTLFAAVIEPAKGASSIASVERLPLASPDPDRVALRITFVSGREDVALVTLKGSDTTSSVVTEQIATKDGKYSLSGRVGLVSKVGSSTRAHLIAGDKLTYPGGSITQARSAFSGTISGVFRKVKGCSDNAFVTSADIPEGAALNGRWIRLNFGTYDVVPAGGSYPLGIKQQKGFTQLYQIDHVQKQGRDTVIVLEADPALAIENGKAVERARPWRTFQGPVSFEIALSKSQ